MFDLIGIWSWRNSRRNARCPLVRDATNLCRSFGSGNNPSEKSVVLADFWQNFYVLPGKPVRKKLFCMHFLGRDRCPGDSARFAPSGPPTVSCVPFGNLYPAGPSLYMLIRGGGGHTTGHLSLPPKCESRTDFGSECCRIRLFLAQVSVPSGAGPRANRCRSQAILAQDSGIAGAGFGLCRLRSRPQVVQVQFFAGVLRHQNAQNAETRRRIRHFFGTCAISAGYLLHF